MDRVGYTAGMQEGSPRLACLQIEYGSTGVISVTGTIEFLDRHDGLLKGDYLWIPAGGVEADDLDLNRIVQELVQRASLIPRAL